MMEQPDNTVDERDILEQLDDLDTWESFSGSGLDSYSRTVLANAAEEIKRLRGQGWQPIETAEPKGRHLGVRFLLFVPPYGATTGHFDQSWNLHSILNKEAQPTHWQPLPQPPEQE